MNWSNLISNKRLKTETKYRGDLRSPYEIDCDKILFSSPFRRLQDKTQVFPLAQNDIVHNRLTHTLEVSNTGYNLGRVIGKELIKRYPTEFEGITDYDIGFIVRAGSLIHDIGNPPFGHAGEKGISEYFLDDHSGSYYYKDYYTGNIQDGVKIFDKKRWEDYENFEGNAQGFRLVTNQNYNSLNLTYSSIACSIKYPKESLVDDSILLKENWRASSHKYGFFQTEKKIFLKIVKHLKLKNLSDSKNIYYLRHPLAFVLEAADDICNILIDLEDSVKMKLIDFKEAEKLLLSTSKKTKTDNYYSILKNRNEKLSFLRQATLFNLIQESQKEFLKNELDIRNGNYDYEIVSRIPSYHYLKQMKKLRGDYTFCCKSVIAREAMGYEILNTLIWYLTDAVNSCEQCVRSSFHKDKIRSLIPDEYLDERNDDKYIDIRNRLVIDYISGMTDNYALKLFKQLKGIQI